MATAQELFKSAWSEALATTKPGTWYATHTGADGHWSSFRSYLTQAEAAAGSDPTVKGYTEQAWQEFLLTTQSGRWYAKNLNTTGHWKNGKALLDKAVAAIPSQAQPPVPPTSPPVTPYKTAVAEVSLSTPASLPPSSRTGHTIRVTAKGTGTLHAILREGQIDRSPELISNELISSAYAQYALPVPDSAAAAIVDYSKLSVKFWGENPTGAKAQFTIDNMYMELPT